MSSTTYNPSYRREHVKEKVSGIKRAMENAQIGESKGGSPFGGIKNTLEGVKNRVLGKIMTAGDSRVCQDCKNAKSKGTPLPPNHPNCRCKYKKRF